MSYWKGRVKSFGYAWNGIKILFGKENNAKFHLGAAIAVIIAGFIFSLSYMEWCTVIICIILMFMSEALNTAIEKLCDHVCMERHPRIGMIKDIAAGAVFMTAIGCAIVGLIVFIPKILSILMSS